MLTNLMKNPVAGPKHLWAYVCVLGLMVFLFVAADTIRVFAVVSLNTENNLKVVAALAMLGFVLALVAMTYALEKWEEPLEEQGERVDPSFHAFLLKINYLFIGISLFPVLENFLDLLKN